MPLRILNVPLLVAKLPDGGERLIPSMDYLVTSQRLAEATIEDLEDQIAESEIEAEKAALQDNIKFHQSALRRLAREIKAQPQQAKKAKTVLHRIQMPTYRELLEMESHAREDEEGMPRLNQDKLMAVVINGMGELPKLFPEGQEPEDPQHVRRCWERWREEAYPNDSLLPFLDFCDS